MLGAPPLSKFGLFPLKTYLFLDDPSVRGRATTSRGVVGQSNNMYGDPWGCASLRPFPKITTSTIPYVNPDTGPRAPNAE